tara:strand:- start:96 stop:545 length:450 start_codon:yes stop_codon:yes gene_type:complete
MGADETEKKAHNSTIAEVLYRRSQGLEEVAHVRHIPTLLFSNYPLEDIQGFLRQTTRYHNLADVPFIGADRYLKKGEPHTNVSLFCNMNELNKVDFVEFNPEQIDELVDQLLATSAIDPNLGMMDLVIARQIMESEPYRKQLGTLPVNP